MPVKDTGYIPWDHDGIGTRISSSIWPCEIPLQISEYAFFLRMGLTTVLIWILLGRKINRMSMFLRGKYKFNALTFHSGSFPSRMSWEAVHQSWGLLIQVVCNTGLTAQSNLSYRLPVLKNTCCLTSLSLLQEVVVLAKFIDKFPVISDSRLKYSLIHHADRVKKSGEKVMVWLTSILVEVGQVVAFHQSAISINTRAANQRVTGENEE